MSMFLALDTQRPRGGSELEPYNETGPYMQALAEIKLEPFLPEGMTWSDVCEHKTGGNRYANSNNAMLNILPPTLPERSSFVRRPRSLTEQSDLSELSVEEQADRSNAALREDNETNNVVVNTEVSMSNIEIQ